MRKKLLMLAFALTAVAAATTSSVKAAPAAYYSCPQCVTYSDGSQCCVPCLCNSRGWVVACTDVYCPPEGGDN